MFVDIYAAMRMLGGTVNIIPEHQNFDPVAVVSLGEVQQ